MTQELQAIIDAAVREALDTYIRSQATVPVPVLKAPRITLAHVNAMTRTELIEALEDNSRCDLTPVQIRALVHKSMVARYWAILKEEAGFTEVIPSPVPRVSRGCACGCGGITAGGTWLPGHDAKAASRVNPGTYRTPKPCKCGCGETTRGGTFRPGHDARYYSAKRAEMEALLDPPKGDA